MRKIIAITQMSLDGVMQAPGGPEEDRAGGFAHGGWAMIFNHDLVLSKRLFEPGMQPHRLKLVGTKAGSGGVVINTYRPDGSIPSQPKAGIKAKRAKAGKAAAGKPAKRKG